MNFINKQKVKSNLNQKGFTLIELLVVIALLGISVGVTNDILLSLIKSYNKTQVKNEIEQQANFVTLKLEKELKNARSVTSTSGNVISFIDKNGDNVRYEISNGIIYRSQNGGSNVNVTSNHVPGGVTVSSPSGTYFSVSATTPTIVGIDLLFRQSQTAIGSSYSGELRINNTIVVRNTY